MKPQKIKIIDIKCKQTSNLVRLYKWKTTNWENVLYHQSLINHLGMTGRFYKTLLGWPQSKAQCKRMQMRVSAIEIDMFTLEDSLTISHKTKHILCDQDTTVVSIYPKQLSYVPIKVCMKRCTEALFVIDNHGSKLYTLH